MAVQQNRKTRAKRGMRRSHDALTTAALTVDQTSGEIHRRHHVTADGFYRGKKGNRLRIAFVYANCRARHHGGEILAPRKQCLPPCRHCLFYLS